MFIDIFGWLIDENRDRPDNSENVNDNPPAATSLPRILLVNHHGHEDESNQPMVANRNPRSLRSHGLEVNDLNHDDLEQEPQEGHVPKDKKVAHLVF